MNRAIFLLMTVSFILLHSCQDTPPIKKPQGKKKETASVLPSNFKYIDSVKDETGLKIKWAKKGIGPKLMDGDVVLINYVVTLPNGKLVDGSSKITKSDIPFIVGFNLQNKGWDIAMKKMQVGDVATILIPSELGWSDKSLGDVLPANSDLIVQLFIVRKIPPSTTLNGSKIWRWSLKKNEKDDLAFGPNKTIKFNLLANSKSEVGLVNTFPNNSVIVNKFEDDFEPASLKKALTNAKKNQGIFILLSPQEVSKIKGIKQKANIPESLLYNIQIVDVTSN